MTVFTVRRTRQLLREVRPRPQPKRLHIVPVAPKSPPPGLPPFRDHIPSPDCWCAPEPDSECENVYVHRMVN